jgi:hypothetical protein
MSTPDFHGNPTMNLGSSDISKWQILSLNGENSLFMRSTLYKECGHHRGADSNSINVVQDVKNSRLLAIYL